jgi:hypothetical protein
VSDVEWLLSKVDRLLWLRESCGTNSSEVREALHELEEARRG